MPRGGRRVGAGRKKRQAPILRHPSAPLAPPPVENVEPPVALDPEARAIWQVQAPLACQHGTLTRASALAFARYCNVAALERTEARRASAGGVNHRGLLLQLNTLELQFLLAPSGKPLLVRGGVAPARPGPNKLDRFRRLPDPAS